MISIDNLLKSFKQNKLVHVSWLYLRCIRRFGLLLGNQVFFKLTKQSNKFEISFSLPGYKTMIYLRPNTSDIDVFETVLINLRFENIPEIIPTPQLIIDAGANIGLVSIFFAINFPNSTIQAVEPESSNYDLLVKNTTGYSNVIPIQAALWKDNSPLSFENINAEKWAFRVTQGSNLSNPPIKTITVNNILAMAKKEFIDIFKIDIEGSEKEVFEENYETWINHIGLFIIELHDGIRKGSCKNFYSAISKLKYHEYVKGENHIISIDQVFGFLAGLVKFWNRWGDKKGQVPGYNINV